MKNRRLVLVLVLLAAAAAALAWWRSADEAEAGALTLYGNVDVREVDLGFRVAGRLAAMEVEEGDEVAPGQLLARLDDETYREALAAVAARVTAAEANLEKLERGSRPQEVERTAAGLAEAEAALADAELELGRRSRLLAAGVASQSQVDAARTRRDETAARVAAARETLALAREGFRREEVAAAAAELAVARAEREQAATRLADVELLAPSAGVVSVRVREPGAMLAAGAPVYTLVLRDPVYVRAYAAEPDLGRLQPGATAWVTTDTSDRRYRGQVGFISPRAEFTPKTVQTTELRTDLVYRLRIVMEEPADGLRQGMPVTVELPLEGGEG